MRRYRAEAESYRQAAGRCTDGALIPLMPATDDGGRYVQPRLEEKRDTLTIRREHTLAYLNSHVHELRLVCVEVDVS